MNSARHIAVAGAMGVGKTTIGRMLAWELGLPFLDSDEMLEARTGGDNAAEIATRDGVERLHELELEVFLDMCEVADESVLAPASSVVDHPRGRSALSEQITVWLTAADDVIAIRQGSGDHRRPIDARARAAGETSSPSGRGECHAGRHRVGDSHRGRRRDHGAALEELVKSLRVESGVPVVLIRAHVQAHRPGGVGGHDRTGSGEVRHDSGVGLQAAIGPHQPEVPLVSPPRGGRSHSSGE